MNNAIILLGGNIGNTLQFLEESIQMICSETCELVKSSKIYETEAWGVENQQNYLNQAIEIQTKLSPFELLYKCQKIENQLGRVRKEKWGARTIDIDIIFYNECIIETENLQIPHPRYHLRNFVLEPLKDIIPNYICPVHGNNILEMSELSLDQLMVTAMSDFNTTNSEVPH